MNTLSTEEVLAAVQTRFPRFTFDDNSKPSLTALTQYVLSAITFVNRLISMKGYSVSDVLSETANTNFADDKRFILDWAALKASVEVHAAIDQFKDGKVSNVRHAEWQAILQQWNETVDPFPAVSRAFASQPQEAYPSRLVRV